MKLQLTLLFIAISFNALSSEVDNFTYRDSLLPDSKVEINNYSNKLFDKVLTKTNHKDKKCDEISLYKNLRREFRNAAIGDFNKYIDDSKDIGRITLTVHDSIYRDLNILDSLILGFYSKYIHKKAFSSIINFNGQYIGVDKFQHFAGSGFVYFENYYLKNNSLNSTLDIGSSDENGLLGAYTTGVISYGDMAAEFNGMRFWNHILAKNADLIGRDVGPYVECQNDRWVKVKEIDFSEYVDASWDEGLNCSNFRTQDFLDKVKERLKKLEDVTGKSYTCPMNREVITNLLPKYGSYAEKIINSDGQKVEKN